MEYRIVSLRLTVEEWEFLKQRGQQQSVPVKPTTMLKHLIKKEMESCVSTP